MPELFTLEWNDVEECYKKEGLDKAIDMLEKADMKAFKKWEKEMGID